MHRVLLILVLVAGCAGRAPLPRSDQAPLLILVSFDGFRWDYVNRPPAANLRRLAARGVRAAGLIPGHPSKTIPNHYSIVTGLLPGTSRDGGQHHSRPGDRTAVRADQSRRAGGPDVVGRRSDLECRPAGRADRGDDVLGRIRSAGRRAAPALLARVRRSRAWRGPRRSGADMARLAGWRAPFARDPLLERHRHHGPLVRPGLGAGPRRDRRGRRAAWSSDRRAGGAWSVGPGEPDRGVGSRDGRHPAGPDDRRRRLRHRRRRRDRRHQPDARRRAAAGPRGSRLPHPEHGAPEPEDVPPGRDAGALAVSRAAARAADHRGRG